LKRRSRGEGDDSYREIRTSELVVSGKKKQDCRQWNHQLQSVYFSHQNSMETSYSFLVISKLLLVDSGQAWKVPWIRLFHMALARIQEDRLVRARA
jgi:hypothetical protein